MIRSWSPTLRRRYPSEISVARGSVVPAILRARRRSLLWIVLALLPLAGGAVGQAPDHQASDARPLADQEPITPVPPPPAADPQKLALGERLFGDPRLSGDGKLACTSCHDLKTNGASDGRTITAHDGSKLPFNTLTVFNAALSFRLNWEGNFRALGAQAESSLENPANMRTSVDEVLGKLNADPRMVQQFRAAYGRAPDRASFLDALVTFERSLLTPGSLAIIQASFRKEDRAKAVGAWSGFGGIAGTAAWIAKVLFMVFLVLFLVSLITGRRPTT